MRHLISSLLWTILFSGVAATAQTTPIIFVHGHGDDAAKWIPIIWLFESNGYPADRLFAIRFTDPAARSDDRKPEAFRSSTTDQASELSAMVTRVLLETKVSKVVLVGSSRGGLTIRNYLKNAGGAAVVSHAILCGTPNHGVMAVDANPGSEFNGRGNFLRQLNDGSEVVAGVRFLTIRSDKLDKYAQPNGRLAGMPVAQTGVDYTGPELKGAENVVIPNLDHREVAFHPLAFEQMYRFLMGHAPKQLTVTLEAEPQVSGVLTSLAGLAATNRPLAGVHFQVFALRDGTAQREEKPILDVVTTETGAWGPLRVKEGTRYEFTLEKDGHAVSYFRAPIARSTPLLNFRFQNGVGRLSVTGTRLLILRPQGYLAKDRDPVTLDGSPVEELTSGLPVRDSVLLQLPDRKKAGVRVELRDELIHARPATTETELNIAEFVWE